MVVHNPLMPYFLDGVGIGGVQIDSELLIYCTKKCGWIKKHVACSLND